MNEKQAFIFFVKDPLHKWQRNQEISNFYMNRIAIDEDDQCDVISVKAVKNWGQNEFFRDVLVVKETLDSCQSQVKKVIVQKYTRYQSRLKMTTDLNDISLFVSVLRTKVKFLNQ